MAQDGRGYRHVRAALDEPGGEGVPQGVRRHLSLDAGATGHLRHQALDVAGRKRRAGPGDEQGRRVEGRADSEISCQRPADFGVEGNTPGFVRRVLPPVPSPFPGPFRLEGASPNTT